MAILNTLLMKKGYKVLKNQKINISTKRNGNVNIVIKNIY